MRPESKTELLEPSVHSNPQERKPPRRRLRWIGGAAAVVLAASLSFGYHIGYLSDNFRTVTPGKCYRSAVLAPEALRGYIRQHGLKTVVDLRGTSSKSDRLDEVAVCEQECIQHVAINVRLGRLTAPEELKKLIETLEQSTYPMLLHCRAGADRTGLATVLYQIVLERRSLDEALSQSLTWHTGHFAMNDARIIDDFFELYRQSSGGQDIKTWILESYPRLYAEREAAEKQAQPN